MEREPPSVRMLAHEHEKLLTPSRLSSSSTVKEEQPKNATGTAARIPPSTRLYRSAWALVLVTIYAGLALFCWVTTCLLATGNPKFDRSGDSSYWDRVTFRSRFAKAQRSYHAARVIQSFVAVLTIPITSAICSSAAVIFAQQKHKASSMSIRQVMALADGSWSDLAKWAQISFAWKRYGSTFLLGAVLLNILGGLVPPLQQALLSSKVIQIPLEARHYQIFDMPDLHQPAYRNGKDDNLISILTRNALNTATDSPYEPQAQLWEGIDANCSRRSYYDTAEDYSPSCEQSGNTFSNITGLRDPFFSELPNSANTGIFRHFAPRINSSAKYEFVSSFPSGCDKLLGAFYVEYANNNAGFEMLSWSIRVCMPANLLTSPWKATRDRQDFSEELYINITFKDNGTFPRDSALGDVAFKVTLNTTAGYFELPNHMNSGLPGPLLLKDPVKNCGPDCPNQRDRWSNVRGRDTISLKGNNSVELEGVYNKGPLLTTAMALFGGGSFLAARIANPSAYQGAKMVTNYTSETSSPSNAAACADFAPMGRLFGNADSIGHSVDQWCLRNEDGGGGDDNSQSLSEYMGEWVLHFNASSDIGLQKLSNTFNTAAFLANQAFVLHNSNSKYFRKLEIYQDPGEDALVPTISFAGIIIVSACLGAHLLGLLLLALYATFSPRWTDKLDAFAMMRIGAAMAQKTPLPLAVGKEMDKIGILDEHPGRIGGSAEEVGQAIVPLELGGPGPINGKSIYLAYAGDSDVPEREAQMRHRAKAAEFRAIAARQRAALAETTRQEV